MGDYPSLKKPEHTMNHIVDELIGAGIATRNDDGSAGVEFPKTTKLPSTILQKRDGTHGYLASDIATIKYRSHNWSPVKMLYFVDFRQKLHLEQVFYTCKQAWKQLEETELYHAYNGFVRLKEGAMSTREGNIIRLESVVEE